MNCTEPRARLAPLAGLCVAGGVALTGSSTRAQLGFFLVPPMEPGGSTIAWGVSPDGLTVVGQGETAAGTRAFASAGGKTLSLGTLPGGTYSVAQAMSGNGVVVGWGNNSIGSFAWRYAGGVMTSLGELSGGFIGSGANAVSADGEVVVGWSAGPSGGEAFRWQNGVMVGLGDFPGGKHNSAAHGVSADGSVVVGFGYISSSHRRAFRWEGGVMSDLGSLSGPLGTSAAWGVTPDGLTVVGLTHSPIGNQAFVWRDGVMTGLGHLGDRWTSARAVSADGSVVVGDTADGSPSIAWMWDEVHGMRSIADVLQGLGFGTGGVTLREATGISADGLTIVGRGQDALGAEQAWIAVIPAPWTVAVVGAGLMTLRRRRL